MDGRGGCGVCRCADLGRLRAGGGLAPAACIRIHIVCVWAFACGRLGNRDRARVNLFGWFQLGANLRRSCATGGLTSRILETGDPGSFSGRTGAFEASNPGSNPGPGATEFQVRVGLFGTTPSSRLVAFDSHIDSHRKSFRVFATWLKMFGGRL